MRKRRWAQFGLRTFLIMAVAIGVVTGWLVNVNNAHRLEASAIDSLFDHEVAQKVVTNLRDGSIDKRNETIFLT